MTTHATCACCGKVRDLCGSLRANDIQQPRMCKDCLILAMRGENGVNLDHWLKQLGESGDLESIANLLMEAP